MTSRERRGGGKKGLRGRNQIKIDRQKSLVINLKKIGFFSDSEALRNRKGYIVSEGCPIFLYR